MGGFLAAVTQREFWSGKKIRQFVSEPQVQKFVLDGNTKIKQAIYNKTPGEVASIPSSDIRAILIFTAEKQQTWLISDPNIVYCVIDQRHWEKPQLKWTEKRENLIPVRADEVLHADEAFSERVGVLHLGDQSKGRLYYSKDLFLNEPPEAAIERFLSLTNA